jgi:hypothetical protein
MFESDFSWSGVAELRVEERIVIVSMEKARVEFRALV